MSEPSALPLRAVGMVDWLSDACAVVAAWCIALSCAVSAGNAVARYAFSFSSNAMLEIQWYLFAACVMLGAAQVLRLNEHVRVDIIYGQLPGRTRVWIDLLGIGLFLIPAMLLMLWFSWPVLARMYEMKEASPNSGGLIRWPAMALVPLGFALVALQGAAEGFKRIFWLRGAIELNVQYERPLQ